MHDDIFDTYEEKYTLKQVRDKKTKKLLTEIYCNAAGLRDRGDCDLPCVIEYDRETGEPHQFAHFKNEVWHRDNGPAFYEIDPVSKIITIEMWCKEGQSHRDGGLPSSILRDPITGEIYSTSYFFNGQEVKPEIEGIDENKDIQLSLE